MPTFLKATLKGVRYSGATSVERKLSTSGILYLET